MKIGSHDIGVCSWSLRAPDTAAMIAAVGSLGLSHCQLALTPLVMADDKRRYQEIGLIKNAGLSLVAGMINFPGEDYSTIAAIRRTGGLVSDEHWPMRRKIAQQVIQIAHELGIKKISTHIGFVPPSNDEKYSVMVQRTRDIAAEWEAAGLDLLLETGQEHATELLQFLNDLLCKNVAINFDPANMILYGAGDPIEAIGILGRHIAHVHVKDAVASENPGIEWGTEVPFGAGQVGPRRFLDALNRAGYAGALTIEREGQSPNRIPDIQAAIAALSSTQLPTPNT
jgi:sugar phosphate isomerase/epimerase